MSKKYFIITADELASLYDSASFSDEVCDQILDTCLARPVPEWATHFTTTPFYVGDDLPMVARDEEIKR